MKDKLQPRGVDKVVFVVFSQVSQQSLTHPLHKERGEGEERGDYRGDRWGREDTQTITKPVIQVIELTLNRC